MIEIMRVSEWLYETLSSDATLTALVADRMYDGIAPQAATFPYITFNWQGGADVSAVGGIRIMNNGLWQVKAVVNETSYATILPIADRVDQVLQRASGAVSDGIILACVREQPLALIENSNGVQYRHLGGLYRIYVQEN